MFKMIYNEEREVITVKDKSFMLTVMQWGCDSISLRYFNEFFLLSRGKKCRVKRLVID